MQRRLRFHGLVVAAVIGATLGTASVASAQLGGPTIGNIPLPRRQYGVRLPSQLPYWINRQDCIADDILTFSMTLTGPFTLYTLEVWAGGSDCTPTQARIGTTATCWKVAAASPVATPFSIQVKARDIVARNLPGDPVPADRNTGIKAGTLADCTDTSTTPPQDVILDFMLLTPASGVAQPSHQIFKTGIDIWGPAPPTDVGASAGETRLHLGWTRSISPDVIRYDFYCDPPPGLVVDSGLTPLSRFPLLPGLDLFAPDGSVGGSGGVGGIGGVTGSGGAGGSSFAGAGGTTTSADASTPTPTGPSCNSGSALLPGRPVDSSYDLYKCGEATGRQAASGTVDNLVNNVQYTVAVVGVDSVLNGGVLSGQACGSPEEVTDFFELYRQSGGTGGGGICSISRLGRRQPALGALLGGMAAAWLLRRRGRRP